METKRIYATSEKAAQGIVEGYLAENPKLTIERIAFECDCGSTHSAIRVIDYSAAKMVAFIIPCSQTRMEF